MGQRIDDEIREQELKAQAKKAAHIEKILTPEGFAETIEDRRKEFEKEIKETLSLWLADVNEPIHKQIDSLQERMTKLENLLLRLYEERIRRLENLVHGHPHDTKEED